MTSVTWRMEKKPFCAWAEFDNECLAGSLSRGVLLSQQTTLPHYWALPRRFFKHQQGRSRPWGRKGLWGDGEPRWHGSVRALLGWRLGAGAGTAGTAALPGGLSRVPPLGTCCLGHQALGDTFCGLAGLARGVGMAP